MLEKFGRFSGNAESSPPICTTNTRLWFGINRLFARLGSALRISRYFPFCMVYCSLWHKTNLGTPPIWFWIAGRDFTWLMFRNGLECGWGILIGVCVTTLDPLVLEVLVGSDLLGTPRRVLRPQWMRGLYMCSGGNHSQPKHV